jgi:murein DD-endopeptidase MepM/ murein hydrolase activator NlpD
MKTKQLVSSLVVALTLSAGSVAAQVRQTTPFPFITPANYHVDDDRNVGSMADFACGGKTYDQHAGTDYGVERYTNAYASADGTIYVATNGCPDPGFFGSTCGGGFGNYFGIDSVDGTGSWKTIAAHMNQVLATVGQGVSCNGVTVLGKTGSSGSSTGPHTHFQVYHYGDVVSDDPYAGDCSGPESFFTCQDYNAEICGVACP